MNEIIHTDLSQPVYIRLKNMILSGELAPGKKIVQEKIAHNLGVSRTPLRQALQKLEFEYLVESIPRRGMYVKKIGIKEMLEVFDVREGIESVAARLAVKNITKRQLESMKALFRRFESNSQNIDEDAYRKADDKFHQLLVTASNNEVLNRVFILGNIHLRVCQIGLIRTPEITLPEHLAIIEALEKKDEDKAIKESVAHIRRSRDLIATIKEPEE